MAETSSMPFFGMIEEDHEDQIIQHSSTPTSSIAPTTTPQKKRRNLPGTPYPDAEVIALSPKTLMATNRFICEVCNKGFQREQNLQLHRRGHNLPWKLKQKSTKEVKRKVYLCPETTCVHHDPSRALGDLTGIKKHFCRKHGEKKWKCDKCSKRYAVQSDWKAHSKTCGTREYRCDCGTLFSRRDSFITHRAFCDALAQESGRLPSGLNTIGSHLFGRNTMGLGLSQVGSQISPFQDDQNRTPSTSDMSRLGGVPQFNHLLSSSANPSPYPPHPTPSPAFYLPGSNHDFHEESSQPHHGLVQNKSFHGFMQLPDMQINTSGTTSTAAAANLFNLSFSNSNNNASGNTTNNNNQLSSSALLISNQFGNAGDEAPALFPGNVMAAVRAGSGVPSLFGNSVQNESLLPQMSATALLQKAAQMGSTTSSSSNGASLLRGFGSSSSSKPNRHHRAGSQMENQTHLQDLMNSLANGGSGLFSGHEPEAGFAEFNAGRISAERHQHENFFSMNEEKLNQNMRMSIGVSDRLTRDFLGVGGVVRSMRDQIHGVGIDSLDGEMKTALSGSPSFGGGSLP